MLGPKNRVNTEKNKAINSVNGNNGKIETVVRRNQDFLKKLTTVALWHSVTEIPVKGNPDESILESRGHWKVYINSKTGRIQTRPDSTKPKDTIRVAIKLTYQPETFTLIKPYDSTDSATIDDELKKLSPLAKQVIQKTFQTPK